MSKPLDPGGLEDVQAERQHAAVEVVALVLARDWCCEECIPDSLVHVRPLAEQIVAALGESMGASFQALERARLGQGALDGVVAASPTSGDTKTRKAKH